MMLDETVLLALAASLSGVAYVLMNCRRTALSLCLAGR